MTKGILAVDISWSNTPNAHQSADLPYENPAKISGAIYSFVPHSVWQGRVHYGDDFVRLTSKKTGTRWCIFRDEPTPKIVFEYTPDAVV